MEKRQKLKKGKYIIGDPCYFIKEWDDFGAAVLSPDWKGEGNYFTYKNQHGFVHGTMYGDGEYSDQYDNRFGVDSGLLACIPLELLTEDVTIKKFEVFYKEDSDSTLGIIVNFQDDFECSYDEGLFTFGHISINTNSEEDEDDDEAEEY